MKFLITGANGFIASKFIKFLLENKNVEIIALTRKKKYSFNSDDKIKVVECDLLDPKKTFKIIKKYKPNKIFHLAAQSNPTLSWEYPQLTIDTNFNSTLNLLNAIKDLGIDSSIYIFSSSSIYKEDSKKIGENNKFNINTPYSLSKFCQEQISEMYADQHGIKTTIIRPFCITGIGKNNDVISDWAKGVVDVEKNIENQLKIGNIDGVARDFLHVDDFILALEKIYESNLGGTYNICSGKPVFLSELINIFIKKAMKPINIVQVKNKIRKINDSILYGNNSKIRALGWVPKKTIDDIVDEKIKFYRKS